MAIVSRMHIGPFSGSNGASEANRVWPTPKESSPQTVACGRFYATSWPNCCFHADREPRRLLEIARDARLSAS